MKVLKSLFWGALGCITAILTIFLHGILIGSSGAISVTLFAIALPIIFFVGSLKASPESPFKKYLLASCWGYLALAVGSLVAMFFFKLILGDSGLAVLAIEAAGAAFGISAFVSSLKNGGKAPSWLYRGGRKESKNETESPEAA